MTTWYYCEIQKRDGSAYPGGASARILITQLDAPIAPLDFNGAWDGLQDDEYVAGYQPIELALGMQVEIRPDIQATEAERLRSAIVTHHSQKADDHCIEDDDALYAAAGLLPCDRRVGDKAAMLANCQRFIERRCEGGGWPTYAEMEAVLREFEMEISLRFGRQECYDQLPHRMTEPLRGIILRARAALNPAD